MIASVTNVEPFENVKLITVKSFYDNRGKFIEHFNLFEIANALLNSKYYKPTQFKQDNLSYSRAGVLRGLHAQKGPFAQSKLVSVLFGAVTDVVLDINPDSKTFGQHQKIVLNSPEHLLFIPPDFAHGFLSIADNTCFSYKVDSFYSKENEIGINILDPKLGIFKESDGAFIRSDKDILLPSFSEFKKQMGY